MAYSSESPDRETEVRDDEEDFDSEYVVEPGRMREGDFKTLDDVRDALDDEESD
ncbi:hypothetical protein NGM10_07920 [Halorussus salilacus]|uniref:hypothetical protein n=1 Tax=Halorussus salilacus TaxID=2953750 RepID=UPI0020A2208A|nr:hypothetical protein [Halorussus salilacus]USZ66672.1 hypothetical protein NGM10_07920 [Halorussus salilacus]